MREATFFHEISSKTGVITSGSRLNEYRFLPSTVGKYEHGGTTGTVELSAPGKYEHSGTTSTVEPGGVELRIMDVTLRE